MTHVVVTGAAGFIGSHVCHTLLDKGFRVTGVDNFHPYYVMRKRHRWAALQARETFHGMEMDAGELDQVTFCAPVDLCIHLAASPGVRQSMMAPAQWTANNVQQTALLLDALVHHEVDKVVFASSSSVYASADPGGSYEDTTPLHPKSIYGETKRLGEALIRMHPAGFNHAILRLFSVYGPELRPDLALYSFAQDMLNGRPIKVFGDGSAARDWTYISDTVAGVLAATTALLEGRIQALTVNLGRGQAVRLDRMIALLAEHLQVTPQLSYAAANQYEVPLTLSNTHRAEHLLGFKANIDLEQGMLLTAQWLKAHLRHA